jgi:hypothetical protein
MIQQDGMEGLRQRVTELHSEGTWYRLKRGLHDLNLTSGMKYNALRIAEAHLQKFEALRLADYQLQTH